MCLGELVVNPHQQHMDAFYWVIDWEGMVSVSSLVGLLEKHFFPKWLQVSPVSACGVRGDSWGDWGHKKKLHGQAGHSAHPLLSTCHRGRALSLRHPRSSEQPEGGGGGGRPKHSVYVQGPALLS